MSSVIWRVLRLTMALAIPPLHSWLRRFMSEPPHLFHLLQYSVLRSQAADAWVEGVRQALLLANCASFASFAAYTGAGIFTNGLDGDGADAAVEEEGPRHGFEYPGWA